MFTFYPSNVATLRPKKASGDLLLDEAGHEEKLS